MNYIIITKKKWNKKHFLKLPKNIIILKKIDTKKNSKINPKVIFFIHWSKIIPKRVCIKVIFVFNFMYLIYQKVEVAVQSKIKFLIM